MVRSTEIIEKKQHMFPEEDWLKAETPILKLKDPQVRRARKTLINQINHSIIQIALKNDRPGILLAICGIKSLITRTIIIDLLRKAEHSGKFWYILSALKLQQYISSTERSPLHYEFFDKLGLAIQLLQERES